MLSNNGQIAKLPLIITGGSGPSLFGRNWLTALRLDWQGIFAVNKVTTLEEILEKYQEGFNDELGLLKGATAKIYTDQEATPKFYKSRPVSYALSKKVEDELERLQEQGIIELLQFSDWAVPIVPVLSVMEAYECAVTTKLLLIEWLNWISILFLVFKTCLLLWLGEKLLRSSTFLMLTSKLS